MPGEAARNSDGEDLVSQIDELKARMDRLMQGGTSTSNSALLTDEPKQVAPPVVEAQPAPAPPPARTRVRDLIGPEDTKLGDDLPSPEQVVSFPDEADSADENRPADRPTEDRPSSPPPPNKPKPAAVGGSVISVDEGRAEGRPKVSSFDDLGSAIEQELARDESVPPPSSHKGPDLASRFGSVEEPAAVEPPAPAPVEPTVVAEPEEREEVEEYEDEVEPVAGRGHVGAVVAIWVFTAATAGAIATLHFTGII